MLPTKRIRVDYDVNVHTLILIFPENSVAILPRWITERLQRNWEMENMLITHAHRLFTASTNLPTTKCKHALRLVKTTKLPAS